MFDLLLGCEYSYVCNQLRTEKEGITVKRQNLKKAFSIQLIFILEIKLQNEHFSEKISHFFS